MKTKSKLNVLILMGIISAFSISCRDHNDLYQGPPTEGTKEFNDFDYTTNKDVTLQISYQNMGGIQTSVDFEVYDQMPVEETEYTLIKKEGVEPIYADRTGNDGTFNKKLSLPAYAKTLYIYTHAFYAQTLLTATVENGIAVATDAVEEEARAAAGSRGWPWESNTYSCIPVKEEGWRAYLGKYSDTNGVIDYTYTGDLAYSKTEIGTLYKVQSNVINSKKDCPEEFRASTDMYIEKDAEIAVTFLGGNTCWNSSMGYYYYKEGEEPNSLQETHVILIFPNTQDGYWGNNTSQKNDAKKKKGVERGTSVQLMYYPDIAKNSNAKGTSIFPKGYRIGFILATNGWTNRLTGFNSNKSYRAATSKGLSVDNNGNKYDKPRTAIYRYTNDKEDMNAVIFSFEDHIDDENFSDVVFTLKTNPIDAITDIPEIEEKEENKFTSKTLRGVYAFEDQWPSKGDYDMNDVLIISQYEKVYDTSDEDKGKYEESFYLKTLENIANNQNGLGLTLANAGSGAEITLTIGGEEAPFTQKGDVILLTDNVKSHIGKEYKLTLTYQEPIKKDEASIQPFIWKKSEQGNWEVHIAQEAPTPLADQTYFGQDDDCSNSETGIYYVREGNYPFAFFLNGATEQNINKLLEITNESQAIGGIYPRYDSWASSKGEKDQDWYKE